MQRYGMVLGLKDGYVERYKQLHEAVWPGVLATITACHIQNYSIYLHELPDGKTYLFSYFDYAGEDFAADGARMAADPLTREWWAECAPCLDPLPGQGDGNWWALMEEIFHLD